MTHELLKGVWFQLVRTSNSKIGFKWPFKCNLAPYGDRYNSVDKLCNKWGRKLVHSIDKKWRAKYGYLDNTYVNWRGLFYTIHTPSPPPHTHAHDVCAHDLRRIH